MIHRFPKNICASSIAAVFRLAENLAFDHDQVVDCDASQLAFVDPVGLCVLAWASQNATHNNQVVNIQGLGEPLARYLQRMDVFAGCNVVGLPSLPMARAQRGVLVEVDRVQSQGDVGQTAARLARTMLGTVQRVPEDVDAMRADPVDFQERALDYVLNELLENGLTHARRNGFRSANAWVACQYYPKTDTIRAAVIDNGCGFLSSLRQHSQLGNPSHRAAIELALEPRVSANRAVGLQVGDVINEGLGLTISKDIVHSAGGQLRIGSGDSVVLCTEWGIRANPISPWQGAVLALDVRRNALRDVRIDQVVARYDDRPARAIRYVE